ncbi:hypothetical protein Pint_26114 [Pistacia integerrima]|uniref:Uncharacterized protein n=1 Tax=Pistacia integerrima TaxID=434235 RepID=A0ACC0YFX5_9ROSI|nr:hypothetical protein Pint_26114 [Pistacia integerrima]
MLLLEAREECHVPTVIFSGIPTLFHPFVISIIFSFTGAFGALLIENKPHLEKLRRCYFIVSLISMASALSILLYASFSGVFFRLKLMEPSVEFVRTFCSAYLKPCLDELIWILNCRSASCHVSNF